VVSILVRQDVKLEESEKPLGAESLIRKAQEGDVEFVKLLLDAGNVTGMKQLLFNCWVQEGTRTVVRCRWLYSHYDIACITCRVLFSKQL
jgi:hypothetical protein